VATERLVLAELAVSAGYWGSEGLLPWCWWRSHRRSVHN